MKMGHMMAKHQMGKNMEQENTSLKMGTFMKDKCIKE